METRRTSKHHPPILAATLLGLTLAGCGGGSGGDDTTPDGGLGTDSRQLSVDATAGGLGAPTGEYTYVELAGPSVLDLTNAEAETSGDWHIAFRRSAIKLNGGVSGPGDVRGAVADAQGDFYNDDGSPNPSVFLNATAEGELAAFEAVTAADGLTFQADRHIPAITGDGSENGWWLYDFATHTVSANDDAWWLVRAASGSAYAKLRVTEIVQAERHISLEMFIQGEGESAFADSATTYTAMLGADGGTACYDFEAAAETSCETAGWDLRLEVSPDGRSWAIWTNGGIHGEGDGAAFGPVDNPDDYPSGTMTASGQPFDHHYQADAAGGLFEDHPWYAYNLQGGHQLWPNYRVYVIDTGSARYKLQILTYYDEAGTSGMYTIRVDALEDGA